MSAPKLEVKVWLEPGFEDGESIAWRAGVFENRTKHKSPLGVGPSRQAALDDLRLIWLRTDPPAEWLSLDELLEGVTTT